MKKSKYTKTPTIHKKEIVINKERVGFLLEQKELKYKELCEQICIKYGLDLTYKGFMSLIANRSTWKLLYAHAIADTLEVNYMDIFEIIDIDIDKKKEEIEEWREKYESHKKRG